MCNAKERISVLFGTPEVGPDIVRVAPSIWAVNMDPERAIEEYGVMILKVRAAYRAVFDNKYVRSFFRAVPGLHEWAMLGKAWYHTTELDEQGKPRFDVVLLDAPATGHGLDMLRVPKVIVEVVPPGILRRDAERAWTTFRDPAQASVVVVTMPEELPATEALELIGSIKQELMLPLGGLVINRVLPPIFSPPERQALRGITGLRRTTKGEIALSSAVYRATREQVQAQSLARLSEQVAEPKIWLPYLFEDAGTPRAVQELAKRL
jgi:anion-transporting  ArsA/GET3 family ATPase